MRRQRFRHPPIREPVFLLVQEERFQQPSIIVLIEWPVDNGFAKKCKRGGTVPGSVMGFGETSVPAVEPSPCKCPGDMFGSSEVEIKALVAEDRQTRSA